MGWRRSRLHLLGPFRPIPCRDGHSRRLLHFPAEAVAHADTEFATESGVAECVLIRLVEEIGRAEIGGNAASELIRGRQVEAGVTGRVVESEAKKVAVGALAGKIAGKNYTQAAPVGESGERARIDGTTNQTIAGKLRRIENVGGSNHQAIVIRVVTADAK